VLDRPAPGCIGSVELILAIQFRFRFSLLTPDKLLIHVDQDVVPTSTATSAVGQNQPSIRQQAD
jgi:hypothetical protein